MAHMTENRKENERKENMTMENMDRLTYSVPECAGVLGLSRSNCYDLVKRGLLPAVRIRGRWLVPKKALEQMLEKAQAEV